MNRTEFIKYIESIGFVGTNDIRYEYDNNDLKIFIRILLISNTYKFKIGNKWSLGRTSFDDVSIIINTIRRNKLKQLLK